jgi:hypothetical protein
VTAAVLHPLTDAEAAAIRADLRGQGIPVQPAADIDDTVHLWFGRTVTIAEEVAVLRAVKLKTDAPLELHRAVAP